MIKYYDIRQWLKNHLKVRIYTIVILFFIPGISPWVSWVCWSLTFYLITLRLDRAFGIMLVCSNLYFINLDIKLYSYGCFLEDLNSIHYRMIQSAYFFISIISGVFLLLKSIDWEKILHRVLSIPKQLPPPDE
jgi:hypothetical protein